MDAKKMFDLTGKVAIVTGAASGLGQGIAIGLAQCGADIVVADIEAKGMEVTAEKIKESGRTPLLVKVDVTRSEEVENMVKKTLDRFGKIDISFNNPGINVRKPILELAEDEWDKVMLVNMKGLYLCAKAVGKVMVEQKRGKIINMASVAGLIGIRRLGVYCSSKGGVVQLTKVLAAEWAPCNVTVNAIAPGYIKTPLVVQVMEDKAWYKEMSERHAMKRFGEVEEIVGPAIFLASDASNFMTGTTVVVDGGWLAV